MSLYSQIQAMKKDWPEFKYHRPEPHKVIWEGCVKGIERQFLISIEYSLPLGGRKNLYRVMPIVRVIKPALIPNVHAREEAPLPHVYCHPDDITLSHLCLFDPRAREWDASMKISRTTVYWTIRWLAAYEIWEATGRWIGGGRHDENGIEPGERHAT